MDIPPGYKQTEIGIIPDDWEISKLGRHVSFKTGPFGSALHKSDYVSGGVPVVNPMQIVNGNIEPTQSMAITEQAARQLSDFRLAAGNIVIGRRGEMGRCAYVGAKEHGWICGTGSMVIRTAPTINARYLQRLLSSAEVISAIENASVGSTMINLNQGTLNNLVVALPPTVAEQEAIAKALSDADTLIASLEQLVIKKRAIKQGAMQELLCPKEDWVEKRLGSTATLKARIGWQGLTVAEYLKNGDYYLVTGTDFKDGYIDWNSCSYVEASRYKQDKNIQLKQHDVLVTKDGTIGKVALIEHLSKPATLNSGIFVLRPIENAFLPEFLYYLLCSTIFLEFLNQLSAGSTINHLYQKDFVNFTYKTPPALSEQTHIATVLSDMDAEIATLEARTAKARQIKQGMMQELLTGRTRLK